MKIKRNKMVQWIVMFVWMGLLVGCTQTTTGINASNKSIVVGIPSESGSLDPAGSIANTYLTYALATSDELLTFDEQGNIEYRGAIAYEQNEDATLWTFDLRQEAQWSNGEAVTAYDYLNTIQRALDPKNGSGYADYLFFIEHAKDIYQGKRDMNDLGIEISDPYTLTFRLEKPCVYFLELLRLPVYRPSYKELATSTNIGWDRQVEKNVANGPFYFSEYVANEYIIIKKNPYYWDRENIQLDQITYRIIPDQQSLIFAYETGEVDVAPDVLSYVMEQYKDKEDLIVSPMVATRYLYPNLKIDGLQDSRVRQALALSIDREELCIMIGADTQSTQNFVATQIKDPANGDQYFMDTGMSLFHEDIEMAQSLLAEAGYPNGEGFPELTYNYPATELDADVAQVLQAQWKKNLGISIRLQAQELQVHYSERRAGNFDLCRMHWTADFADPYTYLSLLMSDGTYNCSGVDDPVYDSILNESNQEMNPIKRSELLHKAEKIAVSEQFYVIPLFSMVSCNLVNPNITGIVRVPATGAMDYRYADIKT